LAADIQACDVIGSTSLELVIEEDQQARRTAHALPEGANRCF
jgi:hypothetical protein